MEVGRYRVVRRIGKGGMAEVFEAVAPGPDGFERRVAVKRLLDAHAGDAAFGRMFLDEARIASQLHHAHIVAVLDYGVEAGHPFQVLEYVDGSNLAELIDLGVHAGTPLPVELALAICLDIAHALDHAHRAAGPDGQPLGIVHRDVSPANILVAWSADVKLSDFGIAIARGRLEETAAGLAKGTLLYMAPEQLMRGVVDGRTDLFSLGCVLHKLVAGQSPLAGEVAMADLVAGAPLKLSPALPADVAAIVGCATQLIRTNRYPDAAALAEALGQALHRRIATDPRTLMRTWLGRVRDGGAGTAPAAGRLDALLGVGPILSGMRGTEASRPDEGGSTMVPARRRWYGLRALAAALPVLAGILALVLWPREPAPAVVSVDAGASPGPRPVVAQDARPDASVSAVSPDAAVTALVLAPSPGPVTGRATRGHASRALPPHADEPAPEPSATGVLKIGGEGVFRAEIEVDGKSYGYAPRDVSLPVGSHEVVLRCTNGKRLTRSVRVAPTHTPSAPLRWTVD